MTLPRILVIDDYFGRTIPGGNPDRRTMCINFSLNDVSPDAHPDKPAITPIADAVFIRGQKPACARRGDVVENDLSGVIETIKSGWNQDNLKSGELPWSMVLLDMCFYTGKVTAESEARFGPGMPEGRSSSRGSEGDNHPSNYFGLKILKALQSEKTIQNLEDLPIIALSSMSRDELEPKTEELLVRAFLPRTEESSPARFKELLNWYRLVPDEENGIIGTSKPLLLVLRKARRAAQGKQDILLLGDTGSGKNLLARAIHNNSPNSNAPFKEVNCAAISPNLIESELFGHTKGAFTGALTEKKGFFLAANGGTLLIDEVGDMPFEVQVKLLSALESRTVTPVGSTDALPFDVRVITATNAGLEHLVNERKFRSDLYYRIRSCLIEIPSLHERQSDIPLLVEHIIRNAGYPPRTIHPDALHLLQSCSWRGNYRELRFCIEQALNDYPEAKTLQAGHVRLAHSSNAVPGKSQTDYDTLITMILDNCSDMRHINGSLVAVGRLVAGLLEKSFEVTRQPTLKDPDGRSIARAMALLTGRLSTESGPAPKRKLKKLLKMILDINASAADRLLSDSFFSQILDDGTKNTEKKI